MKLWSRFLVWYANKSWIGFWAFVCVLCSIMLLAGCSATTTALTLGVSLMTFFLIENSWRGKEEYHIKIVWSLHQDRRKVLKQEMDRLIAMLSKMEEQRVTLPEGEKFLASNESAAPSRAAAGTTR